MICVGAGCFLNLQYVECAMSFKVCVKIIYAAGHTYGKCTQLACQLLHMFGGNGPSVATVTAELVHSVAEALESLMTSKPRLISAWSDCPPLLLFTDGAVEDGDHEVTHGAILIDPWKQCSFYFGGRDK